MSAEKILLGAALQLVLLSSTALAQQKTDANSLLEEITVTARQVKESLQQTPVAVTAFAASMMETSDLPTIADVANLAPNVQFSFAGTAAGSSSSANVYIRGIGQNDFLPGNDPGVGIYVDGVYIGRTLGSVLEVSDAAQVEVLRGPQGTVFGRNNIGGSISLKTRDPGDEFGGRVRGIIGGNATAGDVLGNGSRYELHGRVDIPIAEDLAAAVNFLYRRRGATVKRLDGVRLGNDDIYGGRVKAVWEPSETAKFTFSADFAIENENSIPDVPVDQPVESGFFRAFNNNSLAGLGIQGSTDPACAGNNPLGGPIGNENCANNTFLLGNFITAETSPSRNDTSNWGVNLTGEFDLTERLSMKSITSYRQVEAKFYRAPDGTPFDILFTQNEFEQDQFSQEFQFFINFFDDRLQTVSGAFVMQESASNFSHNLFFPLSPPDFFGGEVDNFNYAFFNESTFDITERWRVLAGGRFTHDHKEATAVSMRTAASAPRTVMNFLSGNALERQQVNFDKATWRFGTQYDLTDDIMSYATVSRGFKSGGFNARLTQPTSDIPRFDPEFVTSWEVGMKTEFPEYGLRFNYDFFFMHYTNIQVSGNVPPEINTTTFNGGNGEIKGFEADLQYSPTQALSIRGAFGFQDAQFNSILPGAVISLDDEFIRTPKFTVNLGITYDIELGNGGTLTPNLDWDYKSAIEFEPVNSLARDPGRNVIDIGITYTVPNGDLKVISGINNLTDKTFFVSGDSNRTCCFDTRSPGRKRNWFLSLVKDF